MPDSTHPDKFLPLPTASLLILLALVDGEKHGYAIMAEIGRRSPGSAGMGPGTLYGSIKRLLASGLIAETDARPDPQMDDQRRRYYELTGVGRQVVQAESQRLADLLTQAGWTVTPPKRSRPQEA